MPSINPRNLGAFPFASSIKPQIPMSSGLSCVFPIDFPHPVSIRSSHTIQ